MLSNNDGCVVARSNESKAMGIKMGTPFYQVKNLVDAGRLEVRSSNYALYGDLSSRVMSVLSETAPKLEIYSIDEAYMNMDGVPEADIPKLCKDLIVRVRRWTGIPVSIGIAKSKTLAKVANHFAKKYKGYKGLCVIDSKDKITKALSLTPIGEVWGIGRRYAPKLQSMGVKTALDFVERPREWVRKLMGIGGVRTWMELQGDKVLGEDAEQARKSICTSRSFANTTSDLAELTMKVSDFAGKCAEKLRKEGTAASMVTVFAGTNRFRTDLPQYHPSAGIRLEVPTNSTPEIVSTAIKALKLIYKPGYEFKRAGVVMEDISDASAIQASLFDYDEDSRQKDERISKIMDRFNASGKNVLHLAVQHSGHYTTGIRREHCSPLFTTSWDEILKVK